MMMNDDPVVSSGTRVVAEVAITGVGHSLVHPRGAVGILVRSPKTNADAYLVRFPDGFEFLLRRAEFVILKDYKERQTRPIRSDGADFALEDQVIYRCVVGSKAYGLSSPDSDTDRRGIYLAPAELEWSLFGVPEQMENAATEECYWELQKFLTLALKANPNILECLYTSLVEKRTPLAEELLAMRGSFLSKVLYQTFNGYAMSQFKKIEQDIRNRGEIKWKHAMHLLRLLISGATALRAGFVQVRVESYRDELLAVKRGEWPWEKVNAWRRDLHRDFEEALAVTRLPERPDYEKANDFLVRARRLMAEGKAL